MLASSVFYPEVHLLCFEALVSKQSFWPITKRFKLILFTVCVLIFKLHPYAVIDIKLKCLS